MEQQYVRDLFCYKYNTIIWYLSNAATTDYNPRNITLTFGAMFPSQCDVINIIDDDENEQQEMFALTLTTSDSAVMFDNDVADVFINNNDCEFEHFYIYYG